MIDTGLSTTLTADEFAELERCETEIAFGLDTFVKVGRALHIIHSRRLYRHIYADFQDYCRMRWGFSGSHAYRLMSGAEIAEQVSPIGEIKSEAVARALGEIPDPIARKAVWAAAVKAVGAEHVTAAIVKGAQTVLETAQATGGYVDTGDGEMTALSAAILQETTERAERQRQHIRDGRKPPLYNDVMSVADVTGGELARRIGHVISESVSKVRVVIYEVEQ